MACFSGSVAGVLGLTGLDGFFFYVVAQLVRPSRHRPAQPCSRLIGAALAAGVLGAAREDGDGYQAMCAAASAPSPLLRRLPARLTLPPPTLADFPYGVQGLLTSQLTGGLLVRPAPSRPLPPPAHRSYAAVAWADCVPVCDRSRICYSGRSSTISVICTRPRECSCACTKTTRVHYIPCTRASFVPCHTFERRPRRSLSEGRLSGSEGRFGVRTTALRPNAIGGSPGTP